MKPTRQFIRQKNLLFIAGFALVVGWLLASSSQRHRVDTSLSQKILDGIDKQQQKKKRKSWQERAGESWRENFDKSSKDFNETFQEIQTDFNSDWAAAEERRKKREQQFDDAFKRLKEKNARESVERVKNYDPIKQPREAAKKSKKEQENHEE